jgi:hypothetical protein
MGCDTSGARPVGARRRGMSRLAALIMSLTGFLALPAIRTHAGSPEPLRDQLSGLLVQPARVLLRGPDAVQQLAVDGLAAAAASRDVTTQARFESSAPNVATVDQSGLITARGDGQATVTVRVGNQVSTVPVAVKEFAAPLPVHFGNQVVPIFTKLGCNAGG